MSGIQNPGRTITLLVRGSNKLVLEEAERSLHDALCVVRCLVRKKAVIAGGGAPETELALKLAALADKLEGIDAICLRAYATALEIIPFTLAENAGLNPIQVSCFLKHISEGCLLIILDCHRTEESSCQRRNFSRH